MKNKPKNSNKNSANLHRICQTFILIITLLFFYKGQAQETPVYKGDPDVSFANARKLAFDNQRKQAQDTLVFILTKYPNYHDVRSFLATTYSWDKDYKKAKKEFDYILENDAKNKEAWSGLIQNELWAESPYTALEEAERALKQLPEDSDILLLKAKAQLKTNQKEQAFVTVKHILKENPNHQNAKGFKDSLKQDLRVNTIGIIASTEFYSENFTPIQYYSLKYVRQTKYGTINPRLNITHNPNRSPDTNGAQLELDLYPKIIKGLYGFLNFGYSNSVLFPQTKYGLELFKALPKNVELSAGMRYLNFTTTNTTFYTGSVGWYTGNSYLNFRTYITPETTGTSVSGTLNYRKYRKDADNYFSAILAAGYSPEVNQLNLGGNEAVKFNLKSQKLNLGYYFTSHNNRHVFGTQLGVTHQERFYNPGTYYWIYFVALSWDLKFK